MKYVINHYSGG